ncbi:MAG TPA: hypothetical protein DDY31_16210 [Lachnospiraceae bacterium]|nr:hypothetical protein [Lachnospiraceae bacterium]
MYQNAFKKGNASTISYGTKKKTPCKTNIYKGFSTKTCQKDTKFNVLSSLQYYKPYILLLF